MAFFVSIFLNTLRKSVHLKKFTTMIRSISIWILASIFIYTISYSQCEEESEQRVILIGDSWAFFMGVDQTINTVFRNWGHSDKQFYTNTTLSENGARTTDFLEADKQQEMLEVFANLPEADHVHLSIGGNDFLGNWKMSFTEEETEELKQEVIDQLLEIIDFIRDNKPGVKIMWSGYVYTNFEEEIERFILPTQHPFYSTWQGMEFPDNESLNLQTINFMESVEEALAEYDDVFFINAPGLMQYHFGQTDPLQVAPFGTYQPQTAELPYGFVEYPSPRNSMRDYGITRDCFHLSGRGYRTMIGYQTQKYYHKALMNDRYYIAQGGGASGSIGSDEQVSSTLFLGENNNVNNHTVVNFELTDLPDTSLQKASLFFHQKTETGSNPFNGSVTVKMKENYFGNDVNISFSDLTDVPSAQAEVCTFGSKEEGHWVRLDLPEVFLHAIKNQSAVSFIISSDANGLVELSGTEDEEFAPVLDLTFMESVLSTEEEIVETETIVVYPNPTKGIIQIKTPEIIKQIAVLDMQGKGILYANEVEFIDLTAQKKGIYIVQIDTKQGRTFHKIVKE